MLGNIIPHYFPQASLRNFGILFFSLVVLSASYALALPGYWLFDESANLAGLSRINDVQSFSDFVMGGGAGPLGRPISLASFALQSAAWPNDPGAFLRVNIVIHILNTFLVYLLATGLATLRTPKNGTHPFWIGLLTAILWGASPFLANTSLMIIQRMTSLSALFVFTGLAAFVWAHHSSPRFNAYKLGLLLIFIASIPLAALSKENGALLPLLATIVYFFWVPKEILATQSIPRLFYLFALLVPSIIMVAYVAHQVPQILASGYGPGRYFSPEERLLSQSIILWDYLRQLTLPSAVSAAPFADNWPAPKSFWASPFVGIAILAWLVFFVFTAAIRKNAPWLFFGMTFFLGAHLIESSIFGLELYFAHRNYVPAFGIYFALVWAAASVPEKHLKKSLSVVGAYSVITAVVLTQTTSTWNDTYYNAILWQKERPYSERAAQFLVDEYIKMGFAGEARRVMDELAAQYPQLARTQIMRTEFCVGEEHEFEALLGEVSGKLVNSRLDDYAALELVRASRDEYLRNAHCSMRDLHALARMASALLENPAYRDRPFTRSALQSVVSAQGEAKRGNETSDTGLNRP